MDDTRTMAQLLEAPTLGYEDAIVVPEITADNFELKHGLLTLIQNKQFFGHDKEDPHAHIRYFNKITSTIKFPNVPNRFNDLLRACPHHGFSELHQLDTFYNALNSNDQDSLNSAAGGNFLDKMPRDCLRIIESKSKVCNSRNKPVVVKVSASSSTPGISPDVAELKDMVKALLLDKKNQNQAPTPMKAVEESCVTCGGAHSYQNYPATDSNVYRDNIQEYVSQDAAANFNQGNTGYRAPIANQIRPPGFPLEFLDCNPKKYDGKGGAIVYTRWIEKMESVHNMSGCRDSQRVKYNVGSFVGKALTWWNSKICTRGREAVVGMSWEDFRTLTREEFCSSNEMQKLETELWNHAMVEAGHATYTDRFHELARLVPHLVTSEGKKIERYVYGLAP
ncbi:reverse transcriptase domain-containing protein [Tanacetum coccineum]